MALARRRRERLRAPGAGDRREPRGARAAAVTAERARIARDLHDLIAHDVSVMVVQAQAAERLAVRDRGVAPSRRSRRSRRPAASADRDAPPARRAASGRRGSARCARSRRCGGSPTLMDEMRERGVETELEVEGTTTTLSPGLDMAAYRILSDGLRSVVDHGGARARDALVAVPVGPRAAARGGRAALPRALRRPARADAAVRRHARTSSQHAADGGGVLHVHLPLGDGGWE